MKNYTKEIIEASEELVLLDNLQWQLNDDKTTKILKRIKHKLLYGTTETLQPRGTGQNGSLSRRAPEPN